MFIFNWFAAQYYRYIKLTAPDVSDSEASYELAEEEELSPEELLQLKLVKRIWRRVGMALGVSHPRGVRLAVQREGLETSVAMWYQGAPMIVIPRDYLSRLVVPGKSFDEGFNPQEWSEWSRFLEESPDQIQEMIAYTQRFSKELPRGKLLTLADSYSQFLTHREFEAELAHEFGHIQARHLNPYSSGRFARWLRRVCYWVFPLLATVFTAVLFVVTQPVGGIEDVMLTICSSVLVGVIFRSWLADKLLKNTVSYVRKQWEKEADAIAAGTQRFCEGNVRLYKKDILLRVIQEQSIDAVTKKVFGQNEFHPSDAERLHFFVHRLREHGQNKNFPRPNTSPFSNQ